MKTVLLLIVFFGRLTFQIPLFFEPQRHEDTEEHGEALVSVACSRLQRPVTCCQLLAGKAFGLLNRELKHRFFDKLRAHG
jgi:hypothetical protein